MKLLKKRYMNIPLILFITMLSLALIGIIVGSFLDLNISEKLVNTNDTFALFFETIGEYIGYVTIPIGGILVFLGLIRSEKRYLRIIGIIILLLALAIGTYTYGKSVTIADGKYGILRMKSYISYPFAFLLMLIPMVIVYVFVDKEDTRMLVIVGSLLIICMLLQFLITNALKILDCRPRYRFLIDSTLNTSGETFRAWYHFKPSFKTDDYHKSWPSGHTATASQALLIAATGMTFKNKSKIRDLIVVILSALYTLLVAYTRIRCGAHFLSDVSFGMLVSVSIVFAFCILLQKKFVEKKQNEVEA